MANAPVPAPWKERLTKTLLVKLGSMTTPGLEVMVNLVGVPGESGAPRVPSDLSDDPVADGVVECRVDECAAGRH